MRTRSAKPPTALGTRSDRKSSVFLLSVGPRNPGSEREAFDVLGRFTSNRRGSQGYFKNADVSIRAGHDGTHL